MNNQPSSQYENEYISPVFIEQFEPVDQENEKEEDIFEIDRINLSNMAIMGTDWTTETIVSQIQKGNIRLDPEFQRRDAWTIKTKSRFIESLFLGLPIPQIILAEHKEQKGKFLVIDGKQRLLTLQQFVLGNDDNTALKLTGLEIITQFNRLSYEDINTGVFREEIDNFNNTPIRTVVIKNWPSVNVLYLIFLRLNTGSIRLSPQELRQALMPGEFTSYANQKSSECDQLKKLLNLSKPDFRMRDVEIFIRYFAFSYFIDSYKGSMQKFLDETCLLLNQDWTEKRYDFDERYVQFKEAINYVYLIFGEKHAFKKYKNGSYEDKYNRSIIDIMLYYFSNKYIRQAADCKGEQIKQKFEQLCTNDREFLSSIEFTTKSIQAVRYRFQRWGSELSELIGIVIDIPTFDKTNNSIRPTNSL